MGHGGRNDCLDLLMFHIVELVENIPESDFGRCGEEEKLKKLEAWNVLYHDMEIRTEEKYQDRRSWFVLISSCTSGL